jgi:hypothetical protein
MIIANRLNDGLVVFRTADGGWSVSIADGLVIEDAADEERLLAESKRDEDNCRIVDPNLIDVSLDSGSPRPTAIREAIRAFGPTV